MIGRIKAVGLVTCSIIASLVLGVTPAMTASKASSGEWIGNGILAKTTFAPDCAAEKRSAFKDAL